MNARNFATEDAALAIVFKLCSNCNAKANQRKRVCNNCGGDVFHQPTDAQAANEAARLANFVALINDLLDRD